MLYEKSITKLYANILFEFIEIKSNNISSNLFYKKTKQVSYILYTNDLLYKFILSPIIENNNKVKILKKIFLHVDERFFQFLHIIILNHRESYLKNILIEYQNIYEKKKRCITKFIIITPVFIKENIAKKIIYKIIGNQKRLFIKKYINKKIIGGFIIRKSCTEWDFSIRNKLKKLKYIL